MPKKNLDDFGGSLDVEIVWLWTSSGRFVASFDPLLARCCFVGCTLLLILLIVSMDQALVRCVSFFRGVSMILLVPATTAACTDHTSSVKNSTLSSPGVSTTPILPWPPHWLHRIIVLYRRRVVQLR